LTATVHAARALLGRSARCAVAPGEVHAWAFGLDADAGTRALCAALLSAEESARAARFVFPGLAERYVVAHGAMRHLLALYAGREPRSLAFEEAPGGKPALAGVPGLAFNLSHSHEVGLLAVSDGREVGADVEGERADVDVLGISGAYFHRSELAAIHGGASPQAQRALFFRYWVAKESVLKAEGCGLGFPLDRFEVLFDAAGEAATIASFDAARMRADWTVRMLSLGEGWPAAVAAAGAWRLRTCGPDG
jgi:4'-phosphopantetheinyl transferase